MPLNSKNLHVLSYANGFTLWHYSTTDTPEEVESPGYFNDNRCAIRTEDVILSSYIGKSLVRFYVVTNTPSGTIITLNCGYTPPPPPFTRPLASADLAEITPIKRDEITAQIAAIPQWIARPLPDDLAIISAATAAQIAKESHDAKEAAEIAQAFIMGGLSVLAKLARTPQGEAAP